MSRMVLVNENLPVYVDAVTPNGKNVDVVVNAWYKPNQKMPTTFDRVLIGTLNDEVFIATPIQARDEIIFRVEDSECFLDYTPDKIKCWMPLPEPPKGDD